MRPLLRLFPHESRAGLTEPHAPTVWFPGALGHPQQHIRHVSCSVKAVARVLSDHFRRPVRKQGAQCLIAVWNSKLVIRVGLNSPTVRAPCRCPGPQGS